jgi:hypothetical protein
MIDLRNETESLILEEDGVGVIEIVLILVVLIGLVLIFKNQITSVINNILKEIKKQSEEVYK